MNTPSVEDLSKMDNEDFIKLLKDSDTSGWSALVLQYAAYRKFRIEGFCFKDQ
jgi:hypothetical protein